MIEGHDFQFGPFRLDFQNERLWREGAEIVLRPKSFAVLRYLVAHAGRLVTRDEVLQAVWPGIVVSEAVLTVCIGEIRQALGDDRQAPQYVDTVHRRGYRFIGTITATPEPEGVPGLEGSSEASAPRQMIPSPSLLSTQHSALNPGPFVGREAALAKLEHWLEQSCRGVRQVVFVTGELGIGKTALVDAFLGKVASGMALRLARGQCIAHYGAGEPYLPVLDALGRLCREPGSEPLLTQLRQHAPTWLVQMPALLSAAELEALQGRLLGASRERMLRELAEALEALTVVRPLILVLEDLHWSDYATLDLISWLAQRRETARLLVLGTYRPVEVIVHGHPLQAVRQELLRHRRCVELPLELLTTVEVARYLAVRFAVDPLGTASFQALARAIFQRTDGHPLFMLTLVDALVQQGGLVERDGRWEVQAGVYKMAMAVPESLQQLVEQQLSQLSAEGQRVLEAASVTGMQFSAAAVAAGLEERVDAVEEQCSTLARRGQFLQSSGIEEWPDGTVAGYYRFRHTLYHQVVYERMPVGRRIQMHARIGAREEVGYQEHAAERAAELATHFEQGREYERAVRYLRQAAEKALQRYAYREAIEHLSRGLTFVQRFPDTLERAKRELDLQIALGQALTVRQGSGATAVERVYARADELWHQVGETAQRIAVVRGLRRTAQGQGDPKKAQPLAEEFLRLAQQAQDEALLIEGHMAMGVCLFYLGDVATAHMHLQTATAIGDTQRFQTPLFPTGQDLRVLSLTYDAMGLWVLGYPAQAIERSRRALKLAEEVAQPWALTMALGYAALVHLLRGDVGAARERVEATIQLATEQGVLPWVGRGMMLRGWALAEQGQETAGLAQMREGLAVCQANGQELGKPFWLGLLGLRYAKMGRVAEGLEVLAEALAMAQTRELRVWEAELQRLRGEFLLQQLAEARIESTPADRPRSAGTDERATSPLSPVTDAEDCLRQSLDIARRQRAKSLELRAAMSLSRLWQRWGKREAARRQLEESYNWFTEGFDTADLQDAKTLLEQLGGEPGSISDR
jgi:DNA-binding winged helix-turn-helix (wHTH) protein/predicted ATPase